MKKPFVPEDLYRYEVASELRYSPSAEIAACQVSSVDEATQSTVRRIWLVPLNGADAYRLTNGQSDRHPRWRPGSRSLTFVSSRGGGPQVHQIDIDGGEAFELCHVPTGVMSFEWSADGRHLLALSTVELEPQCLSQPSKLPKDPAQNAPPPPRIVWRLPYKLDGVGYTLDATVHLFGIDVGTGESHQLTRGSYEVESAAWSPDAAQIVFSRTREGRLAHRTDLWIMNADGSHMRQITRDIASVSDPRWSPDGRSIAFCGSRADGDSIERLWLFELATQNIRRLGEDDVEIASSDSLSWDGDSNALIFLASCRGRQHAVRLTLDGGYTTVVAGDRQLSSLSLAGDRLVFASEDIGNPCNVYACGLDGGGEVQLTALNAWWNDRRLPHVEARMFDVPDGNGGTESIEGWLIRPLGCHSASPLLVDVHGGPASYVVFSFNWHVYWYLLASHGWSILALNAVGSSSYGCNFSERLRQKWGKLDLDQHLAAVERLRKEGLTDERLAITGKSYGGFLTAWAICNSTAFRAAIVSAPVTSLENHYAVSDSGYYADAHSMYGEPKVRRDVMRELSPLTYAENIRTPTLILQGEDDQRCPRCQSEELYTAIATQTHTPAEMILYPEGDHHFFERGHPRQRLDMLSRLVSWLERWIDVPVDKGHPD
ncbi:S9 family peptidase [Trinickia diaoshuihuensis]|uniref:S9 family peptidase n=1 Tax=Trinickia diaoshuihuensis TaxID=2292265 RepID=UPI000E276CF3|nr:S9 family peptidase [Trinickia diaoshuihuensis]